MVNREPPDEFVEIRVRFIVVYLLDSCHDSANDDLRPSEQFCFFQGVSMLDLRSLEKESSSHKATSRKSEGSAL